jgi:hypothetical protein
MKTGNPKQVVVLSIAALGAVGFVIYQALPKMEAAAPLPPQQVASSGGGALMQASLPQSLIADPFTHPALLKKVAPPPQEEKAQTQPPKLPGGFDPLKVNLPPGFHGPLPNAAPDKKPSENAGTNQQSQQEVERVTLTLNAIMATDQTVAMITIDGKGMVRCALGDKVGPATVVEVTDTEVVIRYREKGKDKHHTLKVGQKVEL